MKVKVLNQDAVIPKYQTAGSAAFDLHTTAAVKIYKDERVMMGTGLAFEIPEGHVGVIVPRSSTGCGGLVLANTAGIIDSDYRGEVKLPLWYVGDHRHITIGKGERVAQMIIQPIKQVEIEAVDELSDTERGAGGFGSTNK